ncbi:hypothetical protein ASPBRDRAFT_37754, partial [Aspergillus brasiliensis CBS 101740]
MGGRGPGASFVLCAVLLVSLLLLYSTSNLHLVLIYIGIGDGGERVCVCCVEPWEA